MIKRANYCTHHVRGCGGCGGLGNTKMARSSFNFTGRGGICLIIFGALLTLQYKKDLVVTLLQFHWICKDHIRPIVLLDDTPESDMFFLMT